MTLGRALLACAALSIAGCAEDRLRPGPPSLQLEPPPGSVVASPDTFAVGVYARDDNGLDSIVVTFLGQQREIDGFGDIELVDAVIFTVPEGLAVGELVEVEGYARDLAGGRTFATLSLTVIAPGSR